MFYLLLIYQGNLGCFQTLTIVKNDVVNMRLHISFEVSLFSLDKFPEMALQDHIIEF